MNELSDIIFKISETQAAMRKLEPILSQQPSRPSLQANYQSLRKRQENLEEEFRATSSRNQRDVCAYRMIPDGDEVYPMGAVGSALRDFQRWFSSVYDALKTGRKTHGRLSADAAAESSLNFSFTYPGSLGVVLTIAREKLLFEDTLQLAMKKTTEMLGSDNSEQIHHFAKDLGPPSVRALYAWVQDHVNSGLGADIRWLSGDQQVSGIVASSEHLRSLKLAIEETSDKTETTFEIRGLLVGADTANHTFHMVFPDAEVDKMRGRMSDTIGDAYTVELPKPYMAEISKTTSISYATEEEQVSYFLKSLRRI